MGVNVVLGIGRGATVENALLSQVIVVRAPHGVIGRVGEVDAPRCVGGHHKRATRAVTLVKNGTHFIGVVVSCNDIGFGEPTAHVHLHDVHVPVHTDAAHAVVSDCTNHAADRGSVPSSRDGVVVAARVPAVVIIHKSVFVVVHPIARNLRFIDPVVVDQVHVVVVGASPFENSHHNARAVGCSAPRGDVPCQVAVDVVVSVLHVVPLLAKLRIVGKGFAVLDGVVELCSFDADIVTQRSEHGPILRRSRFALCTEQVNVRPRRECIHVFQTVFRRPFGAVLVVVEHDDEFARQVALGDCCRTDGQQRDREKRLEGVGQFHEGIKSLVAAKLVGVL